MPNQSDAAELWREVNAVKTAWNSHDAACEVRNQNQTAWNTRIEAWFVSLDARLKSLEDSRAKLFGLIIGANFAGGGLVAGLMKLFGG